MRYYDASGVRYPQTEGYLCHKNYRREQPIMRLLYPGLVLYLWVKSSFRWGWIVPLMIAVIFCLVMHQYFLAKARYFIKDSQICCSVLGKIRSLELEQEHWVSEVTIISIGAKGADRSYWRSHFYLFSQDPDAFQSGLIGYGGPGAVYRLIRSGVFLLPINEETSRMMQQRYPGLEISEFPQCCHASAKTEEQLFED